MRPVSEVHQVGTLSLENVPPDFLQTNIFKGDVGLQVAADGRIWLCLDGMAFLRFSPHPNGKMQRPS